MTTIKTKKFTLRPLKKSDAKDVVAAVNNWNVIKYISNLPFPYELKDAQTWLASVVANTKKVPRENFVLGIEKDGHIVGVLGLHGIKKEHKAELGYWLSENCWGQGIMSEAVKIFMTFVFKEFKLKRICANAYPNNKASMRVMEKVGMKFEGVERKGALKNGKYVDLHVFAKVK